MVSLDVPALPAYLRLLRQVSVTVARASGLDLAAIDDVRLAVTELARLLIDSAPDGARLSVTYVAGVGRLLVTGIVPEGPAPVVDVQIATMVGRLVDSYVLGGPDGARFSLIRLRSRARGPRR